MKKLMALSVLLIGGLLSADSIDVTYAKGTDQAIIASLIPRPASPEVDANTSIEAVFTEALDPTCIAQSVRLKHLKKRKHRWNLWGFGIFGGKEKPKAEAVKGRVTYDPDTKTLRFTPESPLSPGFYQVAYRYLMKKSPGPRMLLKPIVYRFYVPKVINGFKLPPEPDPKKNDETLLGIDFNHNGIRDDVERWIIHRYANDPKYPKTKTAIALQYAKAAQYIISHDPEHAYENKTYEIFDRAMDCKGYFIDKLIKDNNITDTGISEVYLENDYFDDKFKSKMFNTKARSQAYWKFNASLSGHILGGGGGILSSTRDKCDIDIHTLGEMQ